MAIVADSVAQVARLESAVIEDRRAAVLATEKLKMAVLAVLGRPETVVALYAAGTLVGVSGAELGRRVVELAGHLTARTPSRREETAG